MYDLKDEEQSIKVRCLAKTDTDVGKKVFQIFYAAL